jgi:hypothetical protein
MRLAKDMAVMRGQMTSCRRSPSRGGAAVEFALVLPIFLAVLFAMIDYGWFFYQRFTLAAAIRDGVRYGVTVPKCAGPPACPGPASDPWTVARDRAKADLSLSGSPINPGNVTWDLSPNYSGAWPNEFMTLTGTMNFTPLVGFVKVPKTMSFKMSMILEIQP